MTRVQSCLSKCLVVCCLSLLLGLSRARGDHGTRGRGRCGALLTIPSDYSKTSSEEAEGNGNIHTRSLSPWTWTATTVDHRIPPTVWEANCSTAYCSYPTSSQGPGQGTGQGTGQGPGQGTGQRPDFRQNSVPIHQQVLILTATGHRKCYVASFLSVSVGCTCVFAQSS